MANSRKKRNITIFAVITIVALAAVLIYQSLPAYMEYEINHNSINQVFPDEINAMTITFRKWGRDSNLHLTLKFTNASFSNQTEQPYDQANSTTVKFAHLSSNKTVCFTVDKNVTGFAAKFSYESPDQNLRVMKFVSSLSFKWNETDECYKPWQMNMAVE